MVALFGAGVFGDGDFLDLEAGLFEEESGFDGGGPEGDAAFGGEGALDHFEAVAAVDPGVAALEEGGGSVVDVEEDGVVARRLVSGGLDEGVNVVLDELGAGVGENFVVESVEEFAVPADDFGEEFGDVDVGGGVGDFEAAAEAEAETEAADEDAGGLAAVGEGAAAIGEEELGVGEGGGHDLPVVEVEEEFAVVGDEAEDGAVRGGGFGEVEGGFHGGRENGGSSRGRRAGKEPAADFTDLR